MIQKRMLLIVSVSLIAGILLSSTAFALMSSVGQPKTGDAIGAEDLVVLRAYHSDGKLFYSSVGHNTLDGFFGTIIAVCASGVPSTNIVSSSLGVSCSDMVTSLFVANNTYTAALSNFECGTFPNVACAYVQPIPKGGNILTYSNNYPNPTPSQSCIPSICTGWNSTTTFSGFTKPFTVTEAGATTGTLFTQKSGAVLVASLDAIYLCTSQGTPTGCQGNSVTLKPGDSLVVTIAFVITGLQL